MKNRSNGDQEFNCNSDLGLFQEAITTKDSFFEETRGLGLAAVAISLNRSVAV